MSEATDAIDLCDEILSKLDDLPDEAEDFGLSVGQKAESIKVYIERNGYVTAKQKTALENMLEGVDRWLENDHDDFD